MKVVIDTNVLLMSIPKHSPYRPIFNSIIFGEIEVLISNEIISEYVEILSRRSSPEVADNIADFLIKSPYVHQVVPYYQWFLIHEDPDDNKFVDCAITGGADYIVTEDKHFNVLKEIDFPSLKVLTIDSFLQLLVS